MKEKRNIAKLEISMSRYNQISTKGGHTKEESI